MKFPLPDIESFVYEDKILTEEDMKDRFAIVQMSFIMKNKFSKKKAQRKLPRLDYQLHNKLLRNKFLRIVKSKR